MSRSSLPATTETYVRTPHQNAEPASVYAQNFQNVIRTMPGGDADQVANHREHPGKEDPEAAKALGPPLGALYFLRVISQKYFP